MVRGIGINDMPRGWRTQSLLNEKIYHNIIVRFGNMHYDNCCRNRLARQ